MRKMISRLLLFFLFVIIRIHANPDAKRLYDDLLSNYNRLIRPVSNNTDTVLVKLGLRLSQLIDLVSTLYVKGRKHLGILEDSKTVYFY